MITGFAGPAVLGFWLGVPAGLGVAMPLGAVGVLIVHEGVNHGRRAAAAAATGVALVDLGYATLAVLAGSSLAGVLSGVIRGVQLLGALILVAVAVHGLYGLRRVHRVRSVHEARQAPTGRPSRHVLRRFVVLTLINPATAVYFVVLTTGLGGALNDPASRFAFVTGVFLASLAWQLLLAAAGSLAGARLPRSATTLTSAVGYLVVLGYAAKLAFG